MSDYVEVGGVRVTQDVLGRAYAWLLSHGCAYVSESVTPSLANFRHPDSTTSSPDWPHPATSGVGPLTFPMAMAAYSLAVKSQVNGLL